MSKPAIRARHIPYDDRSDEEIAIVIDAPAGPIGLSYASARKLRDDLVKALDDGADELVNAVLDHAWRR